MTVNGELVTRDVEARMLLVHFLRDELGLTGTHWGCDTTNCGACVVLYDGEPVKSCTVLAPMADGHDVETVEHLEVDGVLDPVQRGLHGVPRAAVRLLHARGCCSPRARCSTATPTRARQTIREAISGQICRCTGYATIVRSVRWAAEHADDGREGAGLEEVR